MKIAIATDAWQPQINGVVRTYENIVEHLRNSGHVISLVTPLDFFTVPCPTYPSIRLAVLPGSGVRGHLQSFGPDAIHIATEGPIGHAARAWCIKHRIPFTTSFHTRFPEYIRMRMPLPLKFSYRYMRNFHKYAKRTLVPSPSQQRLLQARGFGNVVIWPRGVDTNLFRPATGKPVTGKMSGLRKPVFVYAGRVAVEKNIEAFLSLDLPGSKLVIGDGPDLNILKRKYHDVLFVGFKVGQELADYLAYGDVFVFPSLTDTFGIVMLEAMACGLPVAAFPVAGPVDVVQDGVTGILDEDLGRAAISALQLEPDMCVDFARQHSWRTSANAFIAYLEPLAGPPIKFRKVLTHRKDNIPATVNTVSGQSSRISPL